MAALLAKTRVDAICSCLARTLLRNDQLPHADLENLKIMQRPNLLKHWPGVEAEAARLLRSGSGA